jgi:NRAMP (natural resistance-associated macrophage protein)-like metal ion transporter
LTAHPQRLRRRLAILLAVVGPGIITANVDNDAGGITTYSIAGADWGTALLWSLIPITVLLIVVQEMVNRMGVVTGKGLADLIRENFGVKATFYLMVALVLTNLGNVAAEFAGIVAAARMFGLNTHLVVIAAVFLLWVMVVKGSQRSVERVFLVACLFYVSYVVVAFLVKPDWSVVARDAVMPSLPAPERRTAWLLMLTALVGTTVAPWMQFYQQAAVAEKGVKVEQLRYSTIDTVLGGITVSVIAGFIIVACAAKIHATHGPPPPGTHNIGAAVDAARALADLGEKVAPSLFAFGLLTASLFAASVLPLSTSFSVCEGLGFETGVNKRVPEAPTFYALYGLLLLAGACVVFVPEEFLVRIMYWSQILNGLVLPLVLLFIVRLVRDRRVMGRYANGSFLNATAWIVSAAVSLLTLVSIAAMTGLLGGG